MNRWLKWSCPPLAAAGLLLIALVGTNPAQDKKVEKHDGKSLRDSLKDVINTGADLFNKSGDHAGCYRIYQGGLMSVKPFLPPKLQQEIDDAIAAAEKLPSYADRAFALRKTIDHVRDVAPKLAPSVTKKADDKKPDDKTKPDDKAKADDKAKDKDKVKPDDKAKKPDDKAKKPDDKAKDKDKVKPPTVSLWDRLGKEANVKKVVADFMMAAAEDPKVNVTRNGKYKLDDDGVARLQQQLVDFVSSVTGGPFKYQGKNMKEAHKGMGITNAEFDAAAGHFKKALEKNGAKQPEVNEVIKLLGTTRKDIVEEKQKPAPKKDDVKKDEAKKDTAKKDDAKKDAAKKDDAKKDAAKKDDVKKDSSKKDSSKKDDAKKGETLKAEPGKIGDASVRPSGKVTLDGRPAPKGYVTLVSEDNRRYSTIIQMDGTYGFKVGVPTGKYRVAIEEAFGEKAPQPDIPARYRNEKTSGLALDVSGGPTSFNLELNRK